MSPARQTPDGLERRGTGSAPTVETREDGTRIIRGIAPVYFREDDPGTEFRLWDRVFERVRPGAASSALEAGADVLSLRDHDSSIVLGRTTSGTLTLTDTDRGLEFEVEPPDTTSANDLLASMERGDVRGSSFMFLPVRVTWEEILGPDGDEIEKRIRWLEEVRIFEVGPVTFPAYEASTSEVSGRALDQLRDECARNCSIPSTKRDGDLDLYLRKMRLLRLDSGPRSG